MSDERSITDLVAITGEIVAAYLMNNHVPLGDVPSVIENVHASLLTIASGEPPAAEAEPLVPAIAVRKSVTPDYIVCLEDGKRFKSLKRHLRTSYDMTPEEYRAKWGLAPNYPMVAPNYAAQRSGLAKAMGLGVKNKRAA